MSVLCIADSNELDQRIIKLNLIRQPVSKHVLYFYNGLQLISYLAENKNDAANLPDVILLDLSLSLTGSNILDSLQLLKRELAKKINVYVMSASIVPKDIHKALSYEFVKDFITKPVTREMLAAIIERNNIWS